MSNLTDTTAEQIAAQLNDDGLTWETPDGVGLSELCEQAGGRTMHSKDDPRHWRVVFPDGSALAGADGGWDLEGSTPYSFDGAE